MSTNPAKRPTPRMTSKQRITVAMAGGTPDRVPVTLKLSEMVPVRYATDEANLRALGDATKRMKNV